MYGYSLSNWDFKQNVEIGYYFSDDGLQEGLEIAYSDNDEYFQEGQRKQTRWLFYLVIRERECSKE